MALLRRTLIRCFPSLFYYGRYRASLRRLGDCALRRKSLFSALIERSKGASCLQIGVRGKKYGPHWVSVDLHDSAGCIDYHYDVQELKFADQAFDVVVCNAVLEHVENPAKAVMELHRVLKVQGEIWVEIPFNQPYHPSPNDYWRVTPEGMIVLLSPFRCLDSGIFSVDRSPIYTGVFFWGKKL